MDFLKKLLGEEEDLEQALPAEQPLPVGIENPMVRDYITKTYGDKFSDAKREELAAEAGKEPAAWQKGVAALGNLGDLWSGGSGDALTKQLSDQQKSKKDKLIEFDKGRDALFNNQKRNFELADMSKQSSLMAAESDPMSAESKLAQDLAIKMGVNPEMASKITAEQWKAQGPMYQKMFEVERSKEERAIARQDRAFERSEKQKDREFLQNEKKEEKLVQLQTPFGTANTAQDAKDIKEGFESKKAFDSKLNELISLRKQFGGESVNRVAVNRAKQLSKELLLEYKNMAKLGVLSNSDTSIINSIIPDDPLEYNSPLAAIQGQDPILSNLEKFKQDSDNNFATKISTRTRAGLQDYASGKASTQPELPPEEASAARQKRIAELKAKKAGTYVSK
jgi:hypothetical protein